MQNSYRRSNRTKGAEVTTVAFIGLGIMGGPWPVTW